MTKGDCGSLRFVRRRRKSWRALAGVGAWGVLVLSTALSGQDERDPEELVELPAVEVEGSEEGGYPALSAFTGSRLNTNLSQTPASVSVFTRDFIEDIGVFNLSELSLYGTSVSIEEPGDEGSRSPGATFRMRGLKANRARNYFPWVVSTDVFNIERVDESRGPNAILFGLGSAGGIINASTKVASASGSFRSLQTVVGADGQRRAALDANQAVIEDKLGIRFNAVHSQEDSWRAHEFEDQRRYHLAAGYSPWARGVIRAEVEMGELSENRARPWTARDYASYWIRQGRPIITDTTKSRNGDRDLGIAGTGGAHRMTYVDNSGSLMNWRRMTRADWPTNDHPMRDAPVLSEELMAFEANAGGPGASRETDYATYSVFWEQRLDHGVDLEVAYNHQEYEFEVYDATSAGYQLHGDPNELLPSGEPNPHAGQLYFETNWSRLYRAEKMDTLRGSISYELDLEKLGWHRFAAMHESSASIFARVAEREYLKGMPFGGMPESNSNRLYRRHYVTEGDWSSYHVPDFRAFLLSEHIDPVSGTPVTGSHFIPYNQSIDDDEEKRNSFMLAMQNYFLDGRLATLFGYREDRVDFEDRAVRRNPNTKVYEVDYDNSTETRVTVPTFSIGVVGRPLNWITLLYNRSDTMNTPNPDHRILPGSVTPSPSEGEGEEVGARFDLLDSKVSLSVAAYRGASHGESSYFGTEANITRRNDRILDGLVASGALTAEEADARRVNANAATYDSASRGWETTMVARPSKGWRLMASYSKTRSSDFNVIGDAMAWADDNVAFWSRYEASLADVLPRSVAEEVDNLFEWYEDQTALDGLARKGLREQRFNLFTKYSISGGWLKNASIGGGYRYLSPNVLGADREGKVARGRSNEEFDAVLGYRMKLNNGKRLGLQLNVRNLLDTGGYHITTIEDGDVSRIRSIRLRQPRTWRLSAELAF